MGKLVPDNSRYLILGGGYMASKKLSEQVMRRLAEEYFPVNHRATKSASSTTVDLQPAI
jgi:hypothetical protein